jgi:DNA-damage-inducible protein D
MGHDNEDSSLPHTSPFEAIREAAEDGSEYWNARELAKILGYTQYNKFTNAITKAEEACKNSGQAVSDHFTHVSEMVTIGSGAKRKFDTVFLSRYACYLIVRAPVTGHQSQRDQRSRLLWERRLLSA